MKRFGGGVEGSVTALQHTFEDAVSEQSGLHDLACKGNYNSFSLFNLCFVVEFFFDLSICHNYHHWRLLASFLKETPCLGCTKDTIFSS